MNYSDTLFEGISLYSLTGYISDSVYTIAPFYDYLTARLRLYSSLTDTWNLNHGLPSARMVRKGVS